MPTIYPQKKQGETYPSGAEGGPIRDIPLSWYPVAVCLAVTSLIAAAAAYLDSKMSRRIITEDPPC